MLAATKALAYEWTDGNGVKWSFNYDYNASTATITDVSNNEKNVTAPTTVTYNNKEYTVTSIYASAFSKESIEQVTVPATVTSIIGSESYPNSCSWPVVFTLKSTAPVTLHYKGSVGNACFRVPASIYEAYLAADVWKDVSYRLIPDNAKTDFTVTNTAQATFPGLVNSVGEANLPFVISLTVSGTINSYDFMVLRNKMINLHHLDLTNANIVANNYEHYTGYHSNDNEIGGCMFNNKTLRSIKLPKSITAIGKAAFFNCSYLTDVTYTGAELKSIGESAFYYCGLKALNSPVGLESIGGSAFYQCSNLTTVNIGDGIQTIGISAFQECRNLTTVTIGEGLKTLEGRTFYGCGKLETVNLPSTLTTINYNSYGCFENCSSLKNINLPAHLQTIGQKTFQNCTSLETIRIPSGLQSIGNLAFNGCTNLKDLYTFTIEPVDINQNTFSSWLTTQVHIPMVAKWNYWTQTQWSQFSGKPFVTFEDDYEYFYINRDYTIETDVRIDGEPDADLNPGAGLIIKGSDVQVLDKLHMASNATASASIIANGNLMVENLYFDLDVVANKWYFVTFPFRVKLSNVTSPGNFVFRYYDGAERAANGKGGWKNVTGSYLNAGQGYIFQTNTAGTLTLKVEKADMDFSGNGKQDALSTYAASSTANASWNFLGNPHPCYYDINKTGYTAPITVWNGSAYQAVRAGDDTFFMKPLQAFFVQKPNGVSAVNFPANGRYTYQQTQEQTASARADIGAGVREDLQSTVPARSLVNLTISTADCTAIDQTRVVYNAEKSTAYEMDCDAAKFFSDGLAAQLYTLDAEGTQYAINERPLGEVSLGYVAATAGVLTISAVRMDRPVYLYDNELGVTHDLSLGGYTFQTEAGSNESRFTLLIDNSTTGIAEIEDERLNNENVVYDLQGRHMNSSIQKKGAYIVKGTNGEAKKVIMK